MSRPLSPAVRADVEALAWKLAGEYRDALGLKQAVYERLAFALSEQLAESVGTVAEIYHLLLGSLTREQLDVPPWGLAP